MGRVDGSRGKITGIIMLSVGSPTANRSAERGPTNVNYVHPPNLVELEMPMANERQMQSQNLCNNNF